MWKQSSCGRFTRADPAGATLRGRQLWYPRCWLVAENGRGCYSGGTLIVTDLPPAEPLPASLTGSSWEEHTSLREHTSLYSSSSPFQCLTPGSRLGHLPPMTFAMSRSDLGGPSSRWWVEARDAAQPRKAMVRCPCRSRPSPRPRPGRTPDLRLLPAPPLSAALPPGGPSPLPPSLVNALCFSNTRPRATCRDSPPHPRARVSPPAPRALHTPLLEHLSQDTCWLGWY